MNQQVLALIVAWSLVACVDAINLETNHSLRGSAVANDRFSEVANHVALSATRSLLHQGNDRPGGKGHGHGNGGTAAHHKDDDEQMDHEEEEEEKDSHYLYLAHPTTWGSRYFQANTTEDWEHFQTDYATLKKESDARPVLAFLVFLLLIGACCGFKTLSLLFLEFRSKREVYHNHEQDEQNTWRFNQFLSFRFAEWFSWTPGSAAYVIFGIFVVFVLAGSILYSILLGTRAGLAFFKIFVWIVGPDGGAGEPTYFGWMIGGAMSLGGLMIFACVLTLVQDAFTAYLIVLKEGRSPVIETGHVVIIGFNPETRCLIHELCSECAHRGGTTIVLLVSQQKTEVEEAIQNYGVNLEGSRLVVRSGPLYEYASLKQVAVDTCSKVIICPDVSLDRPLRDATVLRVLLQIRSQNWPINGMVFVVCSLVRNQDLFQRMGGPCTRVVMIDVFAAKLLIQSSQGFGLGMAMIDMLGFSGSEFYIKQVPQHLVGKPFHEASLYYPAGILLGICPNGGCDEVDQFELCPSQNEDGSGGRILEDGEELVILALSEMEAAAVTEPSATVISALTPDEDDEEGPLRITHHASETPPSSAASEVRKSTADKLTRAKTLPAPLKASLKRRDSLTTNHIRFDIELPPENILIIGWGDIIGLMLLQLDTCLPKGSGVVILAPESVENRMQFLEEVQYRFAREFNRITISHVVGAVCGRYEMEKLDPPIEKSTRIFILADCTFQCADHADSSVITCHILAREMMEARGADRIPIIPEISETSSTSLLHQVGIYDYVSLTDLHARVLSSVVVEPRLTSLLETIMTADSASGLEVGVRSLSEYMPRVPAKICFIDLMAIVRKSGDIVVGWTELETDEAPGLTTKFRSKLVLNPEDKVSKRQWGKDDKILVFWRSPPDDKSAVKRASSARSHAAGTQDSDTD